MYDLYTDVVCSVAWLYQARELPGCLHIAAYIQYKHTCSHTLAVCLVDQVMETASLLVAEEWMVRVPYCILKLYYNFPNCFTAF